MAQIAKKDMQQPVLAQGTHVQKIISFNQSVMFLFVNDGSVLKWDLINSQCPVAIQNCKLNGNLMGLHSYSNFILMSDDQGKIQIRDASSQNFDMIVQEQQLWND